MKKTKLYYLDPEVFPVATKVHGTLWLLRSDGHLISSVTSGYSFNFAAVGQNFTPVDNEETPAGTTSDLVD